MGYLPEFKSEPGVQFNVEDGNILVFTRFDDFTATTVILSCCDGTNKGDGHRQKLYNGTVALFLSKALDQVVNIFKICIQIRRPTKLPLSALSINSSLKTSKLYERLQWSFMCHS